MSWFNASHLSSFAKQALTTAQKSIDRVLDIKEEDQWGDTVVMPYDDTSPGKVSVSGGWSMTEWEAPPEEKATTPPLTSEAITTPVTRTVVDESENFFSAFLSPGDVPVAKTKVVSVAPAKSQRRTQERETEDDDGDVLQIQNEDTSPEPAEPPALQSAESEEAAGSPPDETESSPVAPYADAILLQPVSPVSSSGDHPFSPDCTAGSVKADAESVSVGAKAESEAPSEQRAEKDSTNSSEPSAADAKGSTPADPPTPTPSKEVLPGQKEPKAEDRQSDTPSPPVSAFSSGTSTTSDIEVLDHESVLSESSASSRQETGESKAGLHLMQGSFQLLTSSTCGDFARLEDYQKLTESCGSSSDAFERIDSFSVQSLDSRSVSEVNSDDEIPGSRTLASVTAGATPPTEACQKQEDGAEGEAGEEDAGRGEGCAETGKEQPVDEMEESGRSATPVNSEQPDELYASVGDDAAFGSACSAGEKSAPPITEEMKSVSTVQILELQKVIDDLSSRLEKRESQLLAVSKDKARLEEECDNLKDEVIGLKEESSTVQSLKEEFTQRIADAERKAQLACKERDIAKKEIKGLREDLSTRLNSSDTLELIREKEEQIRGLLEEGEKLSKQQLQQSNIIKKLRVKEKESDSRITKQQKKIKEQEEQLRHLQQVLDGKEEVEKQHRENIKKLNAVVEQQEKELSTLHTDVEELQEKNRSVQAALDNSYKELAELHKAHASKASEVEEAALSREIQAKEQLSLALEKAQEEARIQQEALANQVADLRLALQRAEQQQARKEDYLREEISELQKRLQEAETRNQELSQSVTSATRPLLRQIENLQASLGGQTASWEKLEKNISDRLADAQTQLAVAVEKERSAAEELLTIKSQLASLESQNSLLRQEKARVLAQLEAEKNKREKLEKRLSFEQQRSDLWERLYVETKEEKAKGDRESKTKRAKQGMAGKVKETFDAVKNSTKEFVHHHKEQIKKAKEAVKENLRKFSDSVKSTFRHFKDSASTFINKARGFYNKKCDKTNTGEPWQRRTQKPQHRSASSQNDHNTRKSAGKVLEDQDEGNQRSSVKGCSGVFDCAYQESMSLFNKAAEPIRADEFNLLLQSYLQQEVGHFYHWSELGTFINGFFHDGLFIHDRMLFTDFVSRVENYLAGMHEYHGLDDDVFGDLDDYIYRHFFGEGYTKSYGPRGPFQGPDPGSKEHWRARPQQRKQPRGRSRPQCARRWSRSGRSADTHMADVKIELGPMPFDPKY